MPATGSIEKASSLPKPVLHGHAMNYYARMLYLGLILTGGFSFIYKKKICEGRQKRYKDFYENYDPLKEYEKMKAIGIFKGYEK